MHSNQVRMRRQSSLLCVVPCTAGAMLVKAAFVLKRFSGIVRHGPLARVLLVEQQATSALQVNPKRHNVPGMKERGRGRGRGAPRGRGGFFPRGRGRGAFYGGFDPSFGYGGYAGGYGCVTILMHMFCNSRHAAKTVFLDESECSELIIYLLCVVCDAGHVLERTCCCRTARQPVHYLAHEKALCS